MKFYANEKNAKDRLKNVYTVFYRNKGNKFEFVCSRDYLNIGEIREDKTFTSTSDHVFFDVRCINDIKGQAKNRYTENETKELIKKGFNYEVVCESVYCSRSYKASYLFPESFLNSLHDDIRVKVGTNYGCEYLLFINIENHKYEVKNAIRDYYEQAPFVKDVVNSLVIDDHIFIQLDNSLKLDKCVYVPRSVCLLSENYMKISLLRTIFGIDTSYHYLSRNEEKMIELYSLEECRELAKRYKRLKDEKKRKEELELKEKTERYTKKCLRRIKRLELIKKLIDSGTNYRQLRKFKVRFNLFLKKVTNLKYAYALDLNSDLLDTDKSNYYLVEEV